MGRKVIQVCTGQYVADMERAEQFAALLDPNPAHLRDGGNILYGYRYLSGLYLLCLSNRAVLELPDFQGILCGRDASVRFVAPCEPGVALYTVGSYVARPSRKDARIEERRSHLEIVRVTDGEPVLAYSITQLFEVRDHGHL